MSEKYIKLLKKIKENKRYQKEIKILKNNETNNEHRNESINRLTDIILTSFGNNIEKFAPFTYKNGKKKILWEDVIYNLENTSLGNKNVNLIITVLSNLKNIMENSKMAISNNNENSNNIENKNTILKHSWYTIKKTGAKHGEERKEGKIGPGVKIFWKSIQNETGKKYTSHFKKTTTAKLETRNSLNYLKEKTLIINTSNYKKAINWLKNKINNINVEDEVEKKRQIIHLLRINFKKLLKNSIIKTNKSGKTVFKKLFEDLGIDDKDNSMRSCLRAGRTFNKVENRNLKNNH